MYDHTPTRTQIRVKKFASAYGRKRPQALYE
jgi:hypothetical protein